MKSDATIPNLRAYVMVASSPPRRFTFAFKLGSPSRRRPEKGRLRSAPTSDADEPPKTSSRQINDLKRSIFIDGHRTSVTVEDAFWKGLRESAGVRRMSLSKLVASIDAERRHDNLSSAIRLFVLDFYYQLIPVMKRPHSKG
jgi:predicted DNA-binding ribbon-helix-helix protein